MFGRYNHIQFITKKLLILCLFLSTVICLFSQSSDATDSLSNEVFTPDSTVVQLDTLSSDLEFPIFYDANDSIIFDAINNSVLLYGGAVVRYDDIELTADYISYNFGNSVVSATGIPDSAGVFQGKPIFTQAGDIFKPDSLSFNFKTEKAYISNVVTKNGEFYLLSEHTKRVSEEKIFLGKTKITTCDKPNPHFHFHVRKAALVTNENGDKIVSGPVMLKFRKVPTPLALPFGWFPNTKKQARGIIIPTYGNAQQLGYFFRDFGYYLPINEYVDTRLLGDIYTRGSWAIKNITAYKKRYRYNGRFNVSFSKIKNGFRELNNYSENTDFFVSWSHLLDAKARPNLRISASLNFGTSSNFRNNLNSSVENFLSNTFSSNLNVTKSQANLFNGRIPGTLTASARHSQNTSTRSVQVTLPLLTYQTNRIFPFKSSLARRTSKLGKALDGFGVTYTGTYERRATLREQDIRLNALGETLDQFDGGLRNQMNASTSIKAGVVNINPSFGLNSNIYSEELRLVLDDATLTQQEETAQDYNLSYSWNASVNATFKAFGTFNFRNGKKLKAIRHTVTPTLGFSYRPKTGSRVSGFFGDGGTFDSYDPQENGLWGSATNYNNSGSLNVSVLNNLEMKLKGKGDEKPRKVPLLDRINVNTSRDFARDSLNWSNLGVSAGTRIGSMVNVNYQSSHSFYDRNAEGTVQNTFLLQSQGRLTRLLSMGGGATFTLRGTDFKKKEKEVSGDETLDAPLEDLADVPDEVREDIDLNRNDFVDFSTPWSLNLTYTLNRRLNYDPELQKDTSAITQSIIARGDITLFEKWKVGANSGYDLRTMEFTTTELSLYWDLHCWEFTANYRPLGITKSITLGIRVKASALRDLKYDQVLNLGNRNNLRR